MPSNVEEVLEQVLRVRRWIGVHPVKVDYSVSCLHLMFTIVVVCLPCLLHLYLIFSSKDYRVQGNVINSHLFSGLSIIQSFVMLSCSLVSVFGLVMSPRRLRNVKLRLVECDAFLSRTQRNIDYNESHINNYIYAFFILFVSMAVFDTVTRDYHYSWLNRACFEVNDLFSLSNLLNFANYFISLTLNCHYVTLMFERRYYFKTVTMLSWILYRLIGSLLIVQSAEDISNQCKNFKEDLGAVIMIRDNTYYENETLLNFLRMRKIFKFNAIRFFNIDKRFYLSMLSTVLSYLVLIFQLTSSNYCDVV